MMDMILGLKYLKGDIKLMARLHLTVKDIRQAHRELVSCFDGYNVELNDSDYTHILERVIDIDPDFDQSDSVIESELIDYIVSM